MGVFKLWDRGLILEKSRRSGPLARERWTALCWPDLESGVEPCFFLDQIVEHIPVDLVDGFYFVPPGGCERYIRGELSLFYLDFPEGENVGVGGVEVDLNGIHFFRALDLEDKTVFEIHQGVGTQETETDVAELLDDGLGDHCDFLLIVDCEKKRGTSPLSYPARCWWAGLMECDVEAISR